MIGNVAVSVALLICRRHQLTPTLQENIVKTPQTDDPRIYYTIVGVSALLCFAFLLTNSFWLTTAIMLMGGLHLARHFPHIEEFIVADPLLIWFRRLSPFIIIGIFIMVMLINHYQR